MTRRFARAAAFLFYAALLMACSNLVVKVVVAFFPTLESGTPLLALYAAAVLLTLGAFALLIAIPYPHYGESRRFDRPQEELFAVVKDALHNLGWPYKLLWGKEFQARVPTTNWSWHHDVTVRILEGGAIQAESKSAYREMFFDFGRNRRNVETFFARVEQILAHALHDNA
jgi:Protein of unknown function (DUF1499)